MILFKSRTLPLVLSACFAVTAAVAQTGTAGTADRVSDDDQSFLKQAAENGHAEVESSRMALQKLPASSPVRNFAQTMVNDHQRAGTELKALASSVGVEVSAEPSLMQRGKLKLLSTADGEDFARRYVQQMGVDAHEDTIELFEEAAQEADHPEVKAFATKTLPTLRKHLEMAQGLHASHQAAEESKAERGQPKPSVPAATR